VTDMLEKASRELLERLSTELARPQGTAGTHLVGGLTKIGSKLEALLRALLVEMAALQGVQVDGLLPTIGDRPISLRRATGGQVVRALERLTTHHGRLPPRIRALVNDLRRWRDSVISRVIEVRNEAAHEGVVPARAAAAVRELKELVVNHRRDAGWT
jgi:hypothetical protein